MNDNTLRTAVKQLKATHDINFATVAALLGLRRSSFYNWLRGQYDFSTHRKAQLAAVLERYTA